MNFRCEAIIAVYTEVTPWSTSVRFRTFCKSISKSSNPAFSFWTALCSTSIAVPTDTSWLRARELQNWCLSEVFTHRKRPSLRLMAVSERRTQFTSMLHTSHSGLRQCKGRRGAYWALKTGGGSKKRRNAQRMPWNALAMRFSVYQSYFWPPTKIPIKCWIVRNIPTENIL